MSMPRPLSPSIREKIRQAVYTPLTHADTGNMDCNGNCPDTPVRQLSKRTLARIERRLLAVWEYGQDQIWPQSLIYLAEEYCLPEPVCRLIARRLRTCNAEALGQLHFMLADEHHPLSLLGRQYNPTVVNAILSRLWKDKSLKSMVCLLMQCHGPLQLWLRVNEHDYHQKFWTDLSPRTQQLFAQASYEELLWAQRILETDNNILTVAAVNLLVDHPNCPRKTRTQLLQRYNFCLQR